MPDTSQRRPDEEELVVVGHKVERRFGPSGWALDPIVFRALARYAKRNEMTKSAATRLAVRRMLETAGYLKPLRD